MWLSKKALFQITQQARFEGMQQAADAFMRGISHHYEGPNREIPDTVMKAINYMEASIGNSGDFFELANSFQANLMILANVMGDSCLERFRKLEGSP